MAPPQSAHQQEAEAVLRGEPREPAALLALANSLKQEKRMGYARRILEQARRDPRLAGDLHLQRTLAQQHALCTSKDPDQPAFTRHDRALAILGEVDDLDSTRDQETLGIAGGIQKRLWELDGQPRHLEMALSYYLRGYREGVAQDGGYTGINAAFVLDLLASQESLPAGTGGDGGAARRGEAARIRGHLVDVLTTLAEQPAAWWFRVTVAEAYFGLALYAEAAAWLRQAREVPGVAEWELETTARQLAAIARLQAAAAGQGSALDRSEAWTTLAVFLGDDAAAVRTAFMGKVGLALSGGGFRASLFHIGVLARLAELDLLRHVEVLSCVSGGSIIGAHYYLEVRELLEARLDAEITREHYVAIVARIEEQFLAGVQTNIRTRVIAELTSDLRMLLLPGYSPTRRVGELLEQEIFARAGAAGGGDPRRGRREALWLDELFVQPKGERDAFSPQAQNWRRRAKVPILILNATALNTGHVWQFTASFMGEPPSAIDPKVDTNRRLRRMYYPDAPPLHRKIRLGQAVAASACVPGLFTPLPLPGLYPGLEVRLVDGGVHDNQGIAGLLEQDCSVLLVSDASGQMGLEENPSQLPLGVPLRANSILQARVREAQYHEIDARRRSGLLRNVAFVHLKRDLGERPFDWTGCQEPWEASDDAEQLPLTRYGVRKDVQRGLANLRTDLDSFHAAEAWALMASGYRMMRRELADCMNLSESAGPAASWRFLAIDGVLHGDEERAGEMLLELLDAGRQRFFRILKLSPGLRRTVLGLGLGVAVAALVAAILIARGRIGIGPGALRALGVAAGWCVIGVGTAFAGLAALHRRAGKDRLRDSFGRLFLAALMLMPGWPLARLALHVFDPLYLRWGGGTFSRLTGTGRGG
jgi:predicted acylesterase/phospholipase RssA